MTNQQITQAQRLRQQSVSIRDIADQLGVSKSAVDRALKESSDLADLPAPATPLVPTAIKRGATADEVELGKLDLTLSHEREMTKLKIRQDELDLQRRQVELEAERVENEKKLLRLREQHHASDQKAEEERIVLHKEMLTTKFNRLIRELLSNCIDSTWSEQEVADFLERIKSLQNKVAKFCDAQSTDDEELAIHHHLKSLAQLVEETRDNHTHYFGSDVDFDCEKEQIKEIKTWLVDDFDEVYKKPAKKGDVDEDEDDEQEEDLTQFEREKELVNTFNELLEELTDNCKNTTWDVSDYEDYQERLEAFQTELNEYTTEQATDVESHALTLNCSTLLEFIKDKEAVVKETGDTLLLKATSAQQKMLDDLWIEDFADEADD